MAVAKDLSSVLDRHNAKILAGMSIAQIQELDECEVTACLAYIFRIRPQKTEGVFKKYFRSFYNFVSKNTECLNEYRPNFMTRKYWVEHQMHAVPKCRITGIPVVPNIRTRYDEWPDVATPCDIDRANLPFDVIVRWLCEIRGAVRSHYLMTHADFVSQLRLMTPKLGTEYSDNQRLHWIRYGYSDFPKCGDSTCNKLLADPRYFKSISEGYVAHCSDSCAIHDEKTQLKTQATVMRRTGYSHSLADPNVREKGNATKERLYGDKNYVNREKGSETLRNKPLDEKAAIKRRKENTTEKRFGVKCYMQTDEFRRAQLDYIRANGGTNNVSQIKAVRDKVKSTNLLHCGYESNLSSPETLAKKKKTYMSNYGVDHNMKSEAGRAEFIDAIMKKYGVSSVVEIPGVMQKRSAKYFYDGMNFDSAPEVAYYIWLKDNCIEFEFHPDTPFSYTHNGKQHKYFPDFKVGDTYVEIKGLHFFENKDVRGKMINPYLDEDDGCAEAKHLCMVANNVKILTSGEYDQYLKYVSEKYGKTYIAKMKIVKTCDDASK